MDKYLVIGKIVNTHGIKGEIRLLSKFKYKEKVFIKDMNIYIGKNKDKEVINSYRPHKCFDMITLVGYNNINEVLKYKGALVYILREDLKLLNNEYLDEDLIGFDAIVDGCVIGYVSYIEANNGNKVIVINKDGKDIMIPFRNEFVNVDLENRCVIITPIEGMIWWELIY